MELNIKLQGLKYNYEKVQGCFGKILRFQGFSGFMELFSLRKVVEYVHSIVDRVHRCRLTGLRTSLNVGRWLLDRWLRLNQSNRYLGF
jgi:hypothetical protein